MTSTSEHLVKFFDQVATTARELDLVAIQALVEALVAVKDRGGRLFLAGSGGGAGHASHATCDFRKLVGIESYCITDNVSELTARINDESWEESYASYLRASRMTDADGLLVFSVGGGDIERKVSMNLVGAVDYATSVGADVLGIVGRDGGHVAQVAKVSVCIPSFDGSMTTPIVEGFQAVVWHAVVTHPQLAACSPHWESLTQAGTRV